ncbi:C39 family peptidase [Fervidobacterium pennivorans]|nr:C39 family peptidase [Fervidobacterium pennivorans]
MKGRKLVLSIFFITVVLVFFVLTGCTKSALETSDEHGEEVVSFDLTTKQDIDIKEVAENCLTEMELTSDKSVLASLPVPAIKRIEYTTLPLKVGEQENVRIFIEETTQTNTSRTYFVEVFAIRPALNNAEFKIAEGYITIPKDSIGGYVGFSVRFSTPGALYTRVKVYDRPGGTLLVQRIGMYEDYISSPTPQISSILYTSYPLRVNETEQLEVLLSETNYVKVNRPYFVEVYIDRSYGSWKVAEGNVTLGSGQTSQRVTFNIVFNQPGSIYTRIRVYDRKGGILLAERTGKNADNVENQSIIPNVPYYNQYSNYAYPGSTCNLTSVAMMLDYFGITKPGVNTGGWSRTPDYLISRFGGPVYDAAGLDYVFNTIAREKGSSVRMYTKLGTAADLRAELQRGPVIIQGWYTRSGHVMVVLAFDGTNYICNDPAGVWNQVKYGGYLGGSGKFVKYSKDNFEWASTDDGDGLILYHYFR